MKIVKIILSIIILVLFLLLIVQCTDSVNAPTKSEENSTGSLQKPLTLCCNTSFPAASGDPDAIYLINCPTHGDEPTWAIQCTNHWSEVANSPSVGEVGLRCAYDMPTKPASPTWAYAERIGSYVYLDWDFVYAHKYVIERKIGDGTWAVRATINNCLTEQNCGSSYYTDYVGPRHYLYYRIKAKNFDTNSNPSPTAYVY